MSEDRKLFHAPKYPEPPKDMYYQVPSIPPANGRPNPIFPWENTAPKPTRVFADDAPPPAAPSETTPSVTTDEDGDTQTETMSPSTPTLHSSSTEPFATYTRTNAWDDVPEIERYISQLPQNRRAKVQILLNNVTPTSSKHQRNVSGDEPIFSPGIEDPSQRRRPSMKLTDFQLKSNDPLSQSLRLPCSVPRSGARSVMPLVIFLVLKVCPSRAHGIPLPSSPSSSADSRICWQRVQPVLGESSRTENYLDRQARP